MEITSHSPQQTQRIGSQLGELAQAGDVFLLVGELGVGKTCLAQGIAWGLGIDDYATSPSFVLIREYQGRLPLYHIDFYRLDSLKEVIELGLEDYLYGSGLCVVEWAEKGLDVLPEEHLLIRIEYLSENERKLYLKPSSRGFGERYREMLSQLSQKVAGWS